jgi:flavin-dependent dehydrogenase
MIYDALIIGAGPAGSVAALMLARAGWSVALVEKAEFPRRKVCGEYLSPTNHPLFADLGVGAAIAAEAGPEIRRMALYARDAMLTAPMPRPPAGAKGWGRALGREMLDTLLRDAAASAGATVFQPWSVASRLREGAVHRCTLTHRGDTTDLDAKIVIDAHGAPDRTPAPHRGSDLLGFKAHFHNAALAPDLMPVLVFPGGYGGLVTTSGGRVTFGCCIRRDVIEQSRAETASPAGAAVLHAVKHHCRGAAEVLANATLAGPWLATGPIAPGIRPAYENGTFRHIRRRNPPAGRRGHEHGHASRLASRQPADSARRCPVRCHA